MHPWLDLRPILDGIDWVLVGDVATRAYMPERVTKDVDVLIHHRDAEEAMHRFRQAGYAVVSRLAVPGHLLRSPEGVEVDLLFGNYPWLTEALKNRNFDAAGYPVIRLPYLVLMKLTAQRAQDWADVSRMLGWAAASDQGLGR